MVALSNQYGLGRLREGIDAYHSLSGTPSLTGSYRNINQDNSLSNSLPFAFKFNEQIHIQILTQATQP